MNISSLYLCIQFVFIYILEINAIDVEVRVVYIEEEITCDNYSAPQMFKCSIHSHYAYMPVEIMTFEHNVLKFNLFAPLFNYSCDCQVNSRYWKLILVLKENPLFIKLSACEILQRHFTEFFGGIFILNITIFCIYVGAYLLAAFLVTDGVFRNSIQSNLMDKLGFAKAWESDDMKIPPIIIFEEKDGKERFEKIMKLAIESQDNLIQMRYLHRPTLIQMRYLHRPTKDNMLYMTNVIKDQLYKKTFAIRNRGNRNLTHDLREPNNEARRQMILKELNKRRNIRNQAKTIKQKSTSSVRANLQRRNSVRNRTLFTNKPHRTNSQSEKLTISNGPCSGASEERKFTMSLVDVYGSNKTLMAKSFNSKRYEFKRTTVRLKDVLDND